MSTSIHIPEGLYSFHLSPQPALKNNRFTILLKRVVADLHKWLNCSWAAGLVPGGTDLIPELHVVCVEGDTRRSEVAGLICPVRGDANTGLAAIIAAGPRNDGAPYSDEDHHFADAFCGHLSGLLGDERLARGISEDLFALEHNREDAEIAREIYERLDCCYPERIPGLEYGGQCQRAGTSGGDFFGLMPRGERDLVMAIGNVAARGVPAGIMLGGTLASVRALVSRGESLVTIAMELNRTLWELSPEDSLTSFLCAQVDPSRKCLHYVNAGHEPALMLRGKTDRVDRLEPTGAVLGLSRKSTYQMRTIPFDPGDLLAAFTDGVAESAGPSGVLRILREAPDLGVEDLAAHVLATHVLADRKPVADRTVVLVRCSDAMACPAPLERAELVAA